MSNDTKLQQAVLAELSWEPSITANFAEKRAAEAAAGRVKGFKAVAEEIVVKLPFAMKRTDDQIVAAVLDRLAWDVSVPKDKVKVEDGYITLTGDVDWHFQSDAAEEVCRRLSGVVSVLNQISIKP